MTTPPAKPGADTSSKPAEALKASPSTNPWNSIAVGSHVLAQVDKAEGYFPAKVEKISVDGNSLTLTWVGYPKLPAFTMRRLAVGLLAEVK